MPLSPSQSESSLNSAFATAYNTTGERPVADKNRAAAPAATGDVGVAIAAVEAGIVPKHELLQLLHAATKALGLSSELSTDLMGLGIARQRASEILQ